MVFLCMNCCLAPNTVSAFGTPDLIAWHYGGEFTVKSTEDGFTEPDNFNGDYMACYVYGHLAPESPTMSGTALKSASRKRIDTQP